MVTDYVWLSIDVGLGDTRMPIEVEVRMDGLIDVRIGDARVAEVYETRIDYEQLAEFIELLQVALGAAKLAAAPDEDRN